MKDIAEKLEAMGYTVRTGDAKGADTAFRIVDKKQVYTTRDVDDLSQDSDLYKLTDEHHPVFDSLKGRAKKLIARNAYQVLGKNLNNPSDFLICWTPDGCKTRKDRSKTTGGTGQTISIAYTFSVPIFNLKNESDLKRLKQFIK